MKQIENEVVQLIPIQIEHLEELALAANDPKIWEHMSVTLLSIEAVKAYINDAHKRYGEDFAFVIINQATQTIIGATWLLDYSKSHQRVEIGSTWLNPTYWRSAINTNCKLVLLSYCFEDLQVNRVQIKTGHENLRSQKAIERIGATKEGVLRNHMIRKEGTIRHTVMYSITKEEWPEVKQHIQTLLSN
ncbi:GNAT family N-acetyltransferase [Alkalihalobacillus pseudalcaliphilus]|uniref:GNAT family N-acetyltransferase n=1 Tax=Alkalihalobacillus pseudalcaliphilus TaxID=79884 RepID=UPI00064DC490|nr:GNAT family protein [Alkalihalobacillus pseudalcaliphilus]KMK75824.1 GNAT family acetyltransferase [Alkalihalobacillus pseudalcaliphilus]